PRNSRRILVSGFRGCDAERAQAVSAAGLEGVLGHDTRGSLFPLVANGYLGGALFHTPNVYDFPVCIHLARALGGDAIRAHDGRRVELREVGGAELAHVVGLPGIVACAADGELLPEMVHFLLALAVDDEGYRLAELEHRPAVQRDEILARELESHRHDRSLRSAGGLGPLFVVASGASDLRVLEDRRVEVHGLFSLVIEPQER